MLVMQKQYDIDEVAVKLLEETIKEELGKLPDFEFDMRLAWWQQSSSHSPYSGGQKKRSWSGLIGNLERTMLYYLRASSAEYRGAVISLKDCVASVLEKHRRKTHFDMVTLVSAIERLFALLKMRLVFRCLVEGLQCGNACKNDVLKVVQQWQSSNCSDIENQRETLKLLNQNKTEDD